MINSSTAKRFLLTEWPLLAGIGTAILFAIFGKLWLADLSNPLWLGFVSLWLFAIILASAFAIVRHAECLAVLLGEPRGTLVLTIAVIGIEVAMISAVMLTGKSSPVVARDTMFAVIMIILNGMVGLSLLLGGWRHREQNYNLQSANTFLVLIVPLSVLCLVLPNFTTSSSGPTFSTFQAIFLTFICISIYAVFLLAQTQRHREFFILPNAHTHGEHSHENLEVHSTPFHAILLVLTLMPLVFLAKQFAVPIDYTIQALKAPPGVGGVLVAIVILSPEAMSAAKAALANDLQRAINILLGSVLATISLTIPAVLTIGLFTGKTVVLGLGNVELIMLLTTLAVSTLTFSIPRTNIVQGAVHLLLFFSALMLMFEG